MKPDVNSEEFKNAISVQRMRESDKYTIEHFVPSRELMYRAAMGIYKSVDWGNKSVAIVCGSGNNAGDGYALASILADNGIIPTIFRLSERFSEEGKYYYEEAKSRCVKDIVFTDVMSLEGFDIIVDCILGTGFKGKPEGIIATAIERINEARAYTICADINSGVNGDTGEAVLAVKSDLTVSIGFYKKGMFLNDAPKLIDNLVNVDIGIVLV